MPDFSPITDNIPDGVMRLWDPKEYSQNVSDDQLYDDPSLRDLSIVAAPLTVVGCGVILTGSASIALPFLSGYIAIERFKFWRYKRQMFDKAERGELSVEEMRETQAGLSRKWRALYKHKNEQGSLFHALCKGGNISSLRHLATRLDPHEHRSLDGQTPLHVAAAEGHLHLVRCLIDEYGANARVVDADGETPWQKAEGNNQANVLRFIAASSIDQLRRDAQDSTCSICMDNDAADAGSSFTVCDYGCLSPICTDCKESIKGSEQPCPHCRRPLSENIDAA